MCIRDRHHYVHIYIFSENVDASLMWFLRLNNDFWVRTWCHKIPPKTRISQTIDFPELTHQTTIITNKKMMVQINFFWWSYFWISRVIDTTYWWTGLLFCGSGFWGFASLWIYDCGRTTSSCPDLRFSFSGTGRPRCPITPDRFWKKIQTGYTTVVAKSFSSHWAAIGTR